MPPIITQRPAARLFSPFLALLLLVACSIPTEPDGIRQEGFTRIGDQLRLQGNDEGAIDFYQRALQRRPNDFEADRGIGTILEAHNNYPLAESYYAQGLKAEPDDEELLLDEGRILIRLGRPADARAMFQRALDDNKHDVKALNGYGVSDDFLGQYEDAEAHYRLALEEQPDDLTTLNNLAHSYVLAGEYDRAIAVLEPHAKDRDATPALRQNLAEAYGMAGMFADSERLARMDLAPAEVKRNLAYYRARRAKLALDPVLTADLGSYPTIEMAGVEAEKARAIVADVTPPVAIVARSELASIGGTPNFVVRAMGFPDDTALDGFCRMMTGNDIPCRAVKK